MRGLIAAVVSIVAVLSVAGATSATEPPMSCLNGGVEVGGACWYLGPPSGSCDDACAGVGLVYDAATRTFAGVPEGTKDNCKAVLDALGVPGDGILEANCVLTPGPSTVGCFFDDGIRIRCTNSPTDSTAAGGGADGQRACACAQASAPAPTASPYGIAALLIALGGFGAYRLRKRTTA